MDEGGGGEIPGGVCVWVKVEGVRSQEVCVWVKVEGVRSQEVCGWVGGEPRSQEWMKVEGVRSQEVCVWVGGWGVNRDPRRWRAEGDGVRGWGGGARSKEVERLGGSGWGVGGGRSVEDPTEGNWGTETVMPGG